MEANIQTGYSGVCFQEVRFLDLLMDAFGRLKTYWSKRKMKNRMETFRSGMSLQIRGYRLGY